MTKTTFVNGTAVTADFLNAINNPTFDGQALDGHYPKIANSDLSDTAGQIKPEWETFRDTLKVSAGTGLAATYTSGSVTLQSGAIASIAPGTVALTDNATNYVSVDDAGSVISSTTYPVRGLVLAKIITLSGAINGAIQDLRPRFRVQPKAESIISLGGAGNQGDYTLSGTATLSGEYWYKNFTINSGAVLTVSGFLYLHVSGNVTINGTVNVNATVPGGNAIVGSPQAQDYFYSAGQGLGGGGAGSGQTYSYAASPVGSGGGSGFCRVTSAQSTNLLTTTSGGLGGGALIIECAGTVTINGGTINANGGNAASASISAITTPTTCVITGAGGGSGGLVYFKSLQSIVVSATATISVRGGNGSAGYAFNTSNNGGGGSGGGGGYVTLIAPSINTTGATITLTGGIGGSNSGGSALIGGAAGGSFGGQGGAFSGSSPQSGGIGQLILRNFAPV